jgi:hypothetical protein
LGLERGGITAAVAGERSVITTAAKKLKYSSLLPVFVPEIILASADCCRL